MKNQSKKGLILIVAIAAMFAVTFGAIAEVPNMVVNGDFTEGLSSWTTYIDSNADAVIEASSYNDLRASIKQEAPLSWHVQAFQGGLYLEQGRTYYVTFDATTIGKVTSGTVDVCIQKNGGDYAEYMPTQTVSLNPGTGTFSFSFTMLGATDADGRITFNFGKNDQGGYYYPAIISIDNVNVNAGPNMITNGQFNDGMTNWETYVDSNTNAEVYVSNYNDLRAVVRSESPENWYVQAFQSGLNLEQGKTYELTFYTTTIGKIIYGTIDVSVQENGGDYTAYMETETIEANPGQQTITLTFTMEEETDADARVSFNFGLNGQSGSVYASHIVIDNVTLIEK